MISMTIGVLIGISVGTMEIYYLMTHDFYGALIVAVIWPYVVYLHIRDNLKGQ